MADAYTYIRFSTPDQARGDSLRRQQELLEAFVNERNLTLKESNAFKDLGVSGYRGANLRAGLGLFIEEVDTRRVAPGSYLIVESIDRLSRQRMVDSLNLLITLIQKGINVVTLSDGGTQVLSKDAGLVELVVTLGAMHRAHAESEIKSKRVRSAWNAKRLAASEKPVTSRGPAWLSFDHQTKQFAPIPDRVETIRKIYELADSGVGKGRIVKLLNAQRDIYPSFQNPSAGWQVSSVAKLLKNRALIGFYQPCVTEYDEATGVKRRRPAGDEVSGYYPAVIDYALFQRVATRKHSMTKPLRGRQGEALSNLFTGIAYCRWCGSPMTLTNKGPTPKGGRYLVCSRARRAMGCKYRAWRYDDVEMLVVSQLRKVDLGAVLSGVDTEGKLKEIRNKRATAASKLETKRKQLDQYEEALREGSYHPKTVLKLVAELEEEIGKSEAEMATLASEELSLSTPSVDKATFNSQVLALFERMDSAEADERYLIRVRLREAISRVVERIEVRAVSQDDPEWIGNVRKQRLVRLYFRDGSIRTALQIGKNGTFRLDKYPDPQSSEGDRRRRSRGSRCVVT